MILAAILLIVGVMSSDSGPISGTYNARGVMDSTFCQLTITEDGRADFEFILNNDARRGLEFPKLFQVRDMNYEYDDVSREIRFMTRAEDEDRPIVKEMKKYFEPLGEFKIPITAIWTEDGNIGATVMRLDIELELSKSVWDMEEMLNGLKTGEGVGAGMTTSSTTSTTVTTSTSSPSTSAAHVVGVATGPGKDYERLTLSFSLMLVVVLMPLADGVIDWVKFL
jgi:hypothetical protein